MDLRVYALSSLILAGVILCCTGCQPAGSAVPVGPAIALKAPLGLPQVPVPLDNPPTKATIALGRSLFYDTRLSKDNSLACSSCHNPDLGFTDGQRVSRGVSGTTGVRNAPTLLNAAYSPFQFWDGRARSLEEQSAHPIADPLEMNQSHDVSIAKIRKAPDYQAAFAAAFGPGAITLDQIERALASFERTLVSGDSAFDRYQYGGDKHALSPAAVRGLAVFLDPQRGNCAACHTIQQKYALFTDGKFHNTGVGIGGDGQFTDLGRFSQTQIDADQGSFKTPTLRNIALTGPYMHDGSLKTLNDVVAFYAGGGNSNPSLDKEMKTIRLTAGERADLVQFLMALTGTMPPNAGLPQKDLGSIQK